MESGVYIFVTRGPEYRVSYSTCIYTIYGDFNDLNRNWNPVPDKIVEIFGGSKVFTSKTDALNFANRLAEDIPYLDDGVSIIDDFDSQPFSDFISRA